AHVTAEYGVARRNVEKLVAEVRAATAELTGDLRVETRGRRHRRSVGRRVTNEDRFVELLEDRVLIDDVRGNDRFVDGRLPRRFEPIAIERNARLEPRNSCRPRQQRDVERLVTVLVFDVLHRLVAW